MELLDGHRRGREVGLVLIQEHGADVASRVRSVEGVCPPRPVKLSKVVLSFVSEGLGVHECLAKEEHLPQRRPVAELSAACAFGSYTGGEGHGGREVHQVPSHASLLLGIQHAIHRTDDALHDQSLVLSTELQVWLVDDNHLPHGGVVGTRLQQETLLQVLKVRQPDLNVAIPLRSRAAVTHLEVGVVTDAHGHVQAQCVGLIEETAVVVRRIVAIQPHAVGS
mmetsp:Transcript_76105/g.196048  ORF Transcript_76105/g.196048 Transcript_76105/m.196048 type:complete len:223 (+) Transcript_76105:446-1114(+)